ncbi:hypothetical protein [Paenibacillus sp. FSL H8-0034]
MSRQFTSERLSDGWTIEKFKMTLDAHKNAEFYFDTCRYFVDRKND